MQTQFWPRVGYGLAYSSATFAELLEVLRKPYYNILPLCGVNRNIRANFRQLPAEFFGVGLPHPGIEATIDSLNLFLQHFGGTSFLSQQLQTTFEALVLELGLQPNPLFKSHGKFAHWCTNS